MTSNADEIPAERRSWALAQLGRTLGGRYRLDELRGIGGMGAVYVAHHLHVERPVAIKLVLPDRLGEAAREQLRDEARRAASVGGVGVVAVTDFDLDASGEAFLVMELLEGETLAERIARAGARPPGEAIAVARQVLAVLERLHARGLVHGDLKPSNLFLVDGADAPEVKLLDFGITTTIEADPERGATSGVRGTPAFMAPDQLDGGLGPRTDLYGVGAVLYQALSGRRPYEGLAGADVLRELRAGPPHALEALAPELPPLLVRVVERAMARDPEERFGDARAFDEALAALDVASPRARGVDEDATLDAPVPLERSAPATGVPSPSGSRRRSWFLGAGLALAGFAGAAFAYRAATAEPPPAAPVVAAAERVLAPFGDQYLFPAVVVERHDAEARVVFADGDVASVRTSALVPDLVVPGLCLVVRSGQGVRGCVLQRMGDAVLVRFTEGAPRWTSVARLAVPRDAIAGLQAYVPPPPAVDGGPGTLVLANFQGRGGYFSGTIVDRDPHGRVLVVYADGDSEWLDAVEVRVTDLEEGDAVRAAPRRTALPDPDIGDGRILERRGHALRLRFADGRDAWVSLSNTVVPAEVME